MSVGLPFVLPVAPAAEIIAIFVEQHEQGG